MVDIIVPSEYSYVLATAVASALQLVYMGMRVGRARKAAGIPYPYAYAEKEEAEKDFAKHVFNCAQRGHQNTLENFPVFSTLLLVGGLRHPLVASGAGAVYILGRFVYMHGYISGNPAKRTRGAFGYLGLLTLLGATGSTLYHMIAK